MENYKLDSSSNDAEDSSSSDPDIDSSLDICNLKFIEFHFLTIKSRNFNCTI